MKRFKRLIAVFLAVMTAVPAMPLTVFADTRQDADGDFGSGYWYYTAATDTLYIDGYKNGTVISSRDDILTAKYTEHYLPTVYTDENGIEKLWNESFSRLVIGRHIANLDNVALGYDNDTKFYCYPDLTSVEFEEGSALSALNSYQFYKSQIKSIKLPDMLTSIGSYCFANSNLEEITIPSSVTSLGTYAFYSCKQLKSAVIDANITTVGKYTFANSSALERVTLPSALTSISDYAFNECSSLKQVNIPEGIKTIGTKSFYNAALESVILPESITKVDIQAFYSNNISELVIPSTSKTVTIASYAFSKNQLGSLVIPANVPAVSSNAFSDAGITSLELSEGVTTIGQSAFANNDIKELKLPSTVTALGASSFENCALLETLYAPDVDTVNSRALSGTSSLTDIYIPKLRYAGDYAFQGSRIKSIEFAQPADSTVEAYIGSHAFENCTSLSSVKLPGDLRLISPYSFYKCLSLRNISVPKAVGSVSEYSFAYTSINSIKIPNADAYIADSSLIIAEDIYDSDLVIKGYTESTAEQFAAEHSITFEAIDPDSEEVGDETPDITDEQIAANALKGIWTNGTWQITGSSKLTLNIYGDGKMTNNIAVDYNGKTQTFAQLVLDKNISNIVINDGVTSIPDKFMYIDENTRIESLFMVTVANSVESIGDYAFANSGIDYIGNPLIMKYCAYDEMSYFSNQLTHIGKYAFANTPDLQINFCFPMNFNKVEEGTFYNSGVKNVYMHGLVTSFGKKAFANCKNLEILEVPCSVTDFYADNENPANNSFGYNDDSTVNTSLTVYCRSTSAAYDYISENGIGFNEFIGEPYANGTFTATDDYSSIVNKIKPKTYKLYWYYYIEDKQLCICDSTLSGETATKYTTGIRTETADSDYSANISLIMNAIEDESTMTNFLLGKTSVAYDGSLSVDKIVVKEGVTDISASGLFSMFNPEYIELPGTLTALDYRAFEGCDRLKAVTIPDGVTSIDADAFSGCKSLKGVDLGNGITSIPNGLFENINTLQIAGIGDSVQTIGSRAFYNCTALEQIVIPDSVKAIGSKAFYNTIKTQSITLGSGVNSIGEGAFANSVYCERININSDISADNALSAFKDVGVYTDGVRLNYGDNASAADFRPFEGNKITYINLGANVSGVTNTQYLPYVRTIEVSDDNSNFYIYSNNLYSSSDILIYAPALLSEISIRSGTTKIADYACFGTNAVNIEVPASVTEIGNYAFSNSKTLRNIDILKGTTVIGEGAFEDCISLKKFYAPSSLTVIGNAAFKGCTSLASVIPSTKLTLIGDEAFMGCSSLAGMVVEENVESIGDRAFKDCTDLAEIYIWYNTQIGADTFQNDDKLTIYTLAGSDAYRYAREYGVPYSAYTDEDLFYDLCGDKMNIFAGYIGYCVNGHGDTEYLTVYEADCENDGYIIGVCEYCSEIIEEIHTDATGHNYKLTTQIPAAATVRGMKVYTCLNCGQSFCEYIEPAGEDTEIETHTITGTVVIASSKKAADGKSPAKNVSVVIDGMVVAVTDSGGKFSLELETGSYEAELRYAYGFTRTIFIVVENEDIDFEDAIPVIGCDFNKDGKIDDDDLTLFQMVVSSKADDPSYLEFVDMNNDGYINAKDRMYIVSCKGIDASSFKYEDIVIQK